MYNNIGLDMGDSVIANGTPGTVINLAVNSALIELEVLIDGDKNRTKLIQQWYANDALKKIKSDPANTTEVTTEVVKVNILKKKTLEFGVPEKKTTKKKNK